MNLRPVVNWAWCISLENDLPGAPAKSRESPPLFSVTSTRHARGAGSRSGDLHASVSVRVNLLRGDGVSRASFPACSAKRNRLPATGVSVTRRVVLRARGFNMGLMTLVYVCVCIRRPKEGLRFTKEYEESGFSLSLSLSLLLAIGEIRRDPPCVVFAEKITRVSPVASLEICPRKTAEVADSAVHYAGRRGTERGAGRRSPDRPCVARVYSRSMTRVFMRHDWRALALAGCRAAAGHSDTGNVSCSRI